VGGQVLLPLSRLVPHQVVVLACKPLLGCERSVGIDPQEVEGERVAATPFGTPFALGEGEHRPLRGEEETVARTLDVVAHGLIGLALVWDEGERELPIGVEGLSRSS
jgi:hypothetical protein